MGKLTLTIENQPIDFEIDKIGYYLYKIKNISHYLIVQDTHEKGCTFKLTNSHSMSYWWETETRPLYLCSICEDLFEKSTAKGEIEDQMRENHLCFSCTIWNLRAKGNNPLVIDGIRYSLGPGNSGGMAGRKFVIKYFDGTKIQTNDLWCQGEVPEYFREKIPDTAKFLGGAYFDKEVRAWQASR